MIIDVHKCLILGTRDDLHIFFERAQKHGCMEFISPSSRKTVELPASAQTLLNAIKIIKKIPFNKIYDGPWEPSYAEYVAKRIVELREEIDRLIEEKRIIESEIHRVAPFGDFSMSEIDFIEGHAKRKIQFFCVKAGKVDANNLSEELLYVNTEYDLDYFIAINKEPVFYPQMIEMRVDRSPSELKDHLHFTNESIRDFELELRGYAGHIEFLHGVFMEKLNDHNLEVAKNAVTQPHNIHALFSVEAWIPETKQELVHTILEGLSVHCERIKIEESDKQPTHLQNQGMASLGEDLVGIYDIPATSDKDPSGWVFWFFALFFAMIVADGGYGIMYLGLAIYLQWKFPKMKGSSKRLLKLFTVLSCFVVGWGVLTSSFFGLRIDRKSVFGTISPLQQLATTKADYHLKQKDDVYKLWLKDYPSIASTNNGDDFLNNAVVKKGTVKIYAARDAFTDNILLEFSLMVGVIHLSFAFLRYLFRNWAGLGWIAMMVGGYLYFPIKLNATSILEFTGLVSRSTAGEFGIQLMYTGIGSAVLLALLQKKHKGLSEIMNIVQVFADVLSYLRLYALALAGSIMAATFNDMGMQIGFLGGCVVIVAGHAVNILLGVMAGVIHGMRLNFIEWYHFCFEGGGRLFKPLKLFQIDE